jgi:hypothetical protein
MFPLFNFVGIEGFIRQVYMRKKNITHGSENHMSSQNRNLEVQYTPCSDTPIFVAYIYIYHIISSYVYIYIYTVYILTMIGINCNNANTII